MSDHQSDLHIIRAAWHLLPPHLGKSGSIFELRYARADLEGLRAVLAALERIDCREPPSLELVSEIWSLPYYMHLFIGAGQFQGDLLSELRRLEQEFVVQVQRILGVPRETAEYLARVGDPRYASPPAENDKP